MIAIFLLAVVIGLIVFFGQLSLRLAVAAVIVTNAVMLLVSPYINDFMYRFFYDMRWISLEELEAETPASAAVIREVTDEYDYRVPKLAILHDDNPTAFTYGSGRFNARVFLSEGCFRYLDDEEIASVVAHELGHITSRDFITMTLANTLVQILYLIAVRLLRLGLWARNIRDPYIVLAAFGALTYIFYYVSEYAVLYLSRVREYAADEFAAEYTNPDSMSIALVKVAYGILETEDSPELAKATKNIGLMAVNECKEEGMLYKGAKASRDRSLLDRSFLFDLKNPWATMIELRSTHPLTGKRIKRLSEMPGATVFDFEAIERDHPVDRSRMRREFLTDLAVLKVPGFLSIVVPLGYLGLAVVGLFPLSLLAAAGLFLLLRGVGSLLKTRYAHPGSDDEEKTTLIELMADPYASPVRGQVAELTGEIVGKVPAGRRWARNTMLQDSTGLIPLQYRSRLPIIGDFLWALRTVPGLIGSDVRARGWFYRGQGPRMSLSTLETADSTHTAGFTFIGYFSGGCSSCFAASDCSAVALSSACRRCPFNLP